MIGGSFQTILAYTTHTETEQYVLLHVHCNCLQLQFTIIGGERKEEETTAASHDTTSGIKGSHTHPSVASFAAFFPCSTKFAYCKRRLNAAEA